MSENIEFSDNVLAAIKANRKIEAIKLLRKEQGLGLKDAKDVVDAHLAKHRSRTTPPARKSGVRIGPLLLAAALTALYVAYRFLS